MTLKTESHEIYFEIKDIMDDIRSPTCWCVSRHRAQLTGAAPPSELRAS